MKKKVIVSLLSAAAMVLVLVGCTEQTMTKDFGGTTNIDLEPGKKLEEITWKDEDSLWLLTRDMRDDEESEVHHFKESSAFGLIEGEVIITEHER